MTMNGHEPATSMSSENGVENSHQSAKNYGPINVSGNARVQLGDRYEANRDVFESGTLEQQRTGEPLHHSLDNMSAIYSQQHYQLF